MIKLMFYGNEVKWPVYLETKQAKNYSNGSATQIRQLTTKQFERESKKLQKELQKRRKNARKTND